MTDGQITGMSDEDFYNKIQLEKEIRAEGYSPTTRERLPFAYSTSGLGYGSTGAGSATTPTGGSAWDKYLESQKDLLNFYKNLIGYSGTKYNTPWSSAYQ